MKIYAAFYDDDMTRGFLHSHSYTAIRSACRAALATLRAVRQRECLEENGANRPCCAPR